MSQTSAKKVLIMAGGTGGHIFPALSIARHLQSMGVVVEWLGTRKGMESRIVPETDIPIHYISVSGLRGKSRLTILLSPFVITLAICQALAKLWSCKPCCVLGMGGFVTGPGGVAAWMLGKPLLIHEQNAIAGLSNQILSPLATVVMEGFAGAFKRKQMLSKRSLIRFKPDKAIHVGNPLRKEVLDCEPPEKRFAGREEQRIRLLIVGGSLGAQAINRFLPEFLAEYSNANKVELWHQCGKNNLDDCLQAYKQAGINTDEIKVSAFIDDMAQAYAWADVVLCRAGASTVSEIAAVGVPAVFVPFPHAVDDHQTENALILQKLGAAWIIQQHELSSTKLADILDRFLANRALILQTALLAQDAAKPEATETAAGYCMEACYA